MLPQSRGQDQAARALLTEALSALANDRSLDARSKVLFHFDIANEFGKGGLVDYAKACMQTCLRASIEAFGPHHVRTGSILAFVAQLGGGSGARALAQLETALGIQRAGGGPNHPDIAFTLSSMGQLLLVGRARAAHLP